IRGPKTTAADVRRPWRFPAAQLLLRPQCFLLPVSSSLFKHQGGFVGFFSYFSAASTECHTPPSLTFSARDRKTEKKPNNPNLSLLLCQHPKRVPMHISLLYQLQSIDDFAFYPVQPAPQAMVAQ